jgi:CxxC motif-containing protein (DUF1111 family)
VNEISFTLDDSDGQLRFKRFALADGIVPAKLKQRLESYFIGRALSQVHILELKALLAGTDHDTRTRVVQMMREYQHFFRGSMGRYASDDRPEFNASAGQPGTEPRQPKTATQAP